MHRFLLLKRFCVRVMSCPSTPEGGSVTEYKQAYISVNKHDTGSWAHCTALSYLCVSWGSIIRNVNQTNDLHDTNIVEKTSSKGMAVARCSVRLQQMSPCWSREDFAFMTYTLSQHYSAMLWNWPLSELLHLAGKTRIQRTSHNSPQPVCVWPPTQSQVPNGKVPPRVPLFTHGSNHHREAGKWVVDDVMID